MKYLIVECYQAYAVALCEDGSFLKVANIHYEVGQSVTEVFPINIPESKPKVLQIKWIYPILTAAACLILLLVPTLLQFAKPAASVYMAINPQVRIDVNKNDIVTTLSAENDDGATLLSNYNYRRKALNLVLDELVDRAIEMEYLRDGGKVTLTLDSKNADWITTRSESLNNNVKHHLKDKIDAKVEVTTKAESTQTNSVSSQPESEQSTTITSNTCTNPDCEIENCDGTQCKKNENSTPSSSSISTPSSNIESNTTSSIPEKVESTTSNKTESTTSSKPSSTTSSTNSNTSSTTTTPSKPESDKKPTTSSDKDTTSSDKNNNSSNNSSNSSGLKPDNNQNNNKPNYNFPFSDYFDKYFDKYFDFDYEVYYYTFEN
jgi:hypothetical protein